MNGVVGVSSREQIVEAAAATLLDSGYEGTTVRAVATRAGVAVGNVQYYFPSKTDLLIAAWHHLTDRSVADFRHALDALADPVAILAGGWEGLWSSLREVGDQQLAAFDLLIQASRFDPLRAYVPEVFQRYREVIEEQLDRLARETPIRLKVNRDVLIPLILNTVLGFGLYYAVTGDEESCLKALRAFGPVAESMVTVET